MAGGFNTNTRQKFVRLPALTKPVGGGMVSRELPKAGLLGNLFLQIRGSVSGTLTSPNPLGFASVINGVRLTLNTGIDLFNLSGAHLYYLLNELLESEYHLAIANDGRTAVAATSFNLDTIIPVRLNLRDPVGLVMLQSEQTTVTLVVDFASDSTVATGATVTAVVTPLLELFTVPADTADWPPLNVLHQVIGDSQSVTGGADVTYEPPRGNTYVQLAHGFGIGAAGTDQWSRFIVRVNQSDTIADLTPEFADMLHLFYRGRTRPAGGIYVDYIGSSGLGTYGLARDLFNSALTTDYAHVITPTTSGTLYSMRRQLVPLTP